MRDYKFVDRYLSELAGDIYAQPDDAGHTELTQKVINFWMSRVPLCKYVLDVGCGTGFAQPMFEQWGQEYTGVCLGEDYIEAQKQNRNVLLADFNFLEFEDDSFDLVFSRHSLEHSFSPLISLLEWRRISRAWLGVILPDPRHYKPGGRNHPFVLYKEQWEALFEIAGWHPLWTNEELGADGEVWEMWYFLEKSSRPKYE